MHRKDFFKGIQRCFDGNTTGGKIVCGDFNCVLDNDLDIVSGDPHSLRDVDLFKTMIVETELNDLWRLSHEGEREFTWSRKSPFIARRLDYVFVSDELLNKSYECQIQSVAQSDHRLISLKYSLSSFNRGPSYWKFNDSLLNDKTFVDEMNFFIETSAEELSILEPQNKWDLCKVKIKEFCIAFSKEKKKRLLAQQKNLQQKLDKADTLLSINPQNHALLISREDIKHKLELFDIQQAKSAQVRSREKFIAEGEKNTRYFFNLERARGNAKMMDRLRTEDGQTVTSQTGILREQVKFYNNVSVKRTTLKKMRLIIL